MNISTFRNHIKDRAGIPRSRNSWEFTESDYEIIRVPKSVIPEGGKLIEAYETATGFAILGDPEDEPEGLTEEQLSAWYETAHNCDAMGCGTFSHVIYRFPKQQPAAPPAAPEETR